MNGPRIYWLSSNRMTFVATVEDGIVTEAAPIARWAIGVPLGSLLAWLRRQGGMVYQELPLGVIRDA